MSRQTMFGADARARVEQWLAGPPEPAVRDSLERLAAVRGIVQLAVMPDVHLAEEVCIGVALATSGTLYPGAVGADIGCGMVAIGFDCGADLLGDETRAARLLTRLYDTVPANRHGRDGAVSRLPPQLETPLSDPRLERMKQRDGRVQFGTLGRGNHFLELQRDGDDRLWLMLHSGSRAMGQAIRDHHLRGAARDPGLPYLEADSDAGRAYLEDHLWAIRYAELSRLRMVDQTCALMEHLFGVRADRDTLIGCHHNHVQLEDHAGRRLWVHRKGALDAHPGVRGVIGGSMGTPSYHVTGRGHEPALCSSSHGAGRRMSRGEARRRIPPGALEQELEGVYFDHRQAHRLCDEAPSAYRDIDRVMRAQRALTRIDRKLWPVLAFKGT